MPHIHTNDNQHDVTVSAYIIRTDSDEPRALLHLHKKIGVLLPVGGHVELNETPWQAITHELKEESGYDINQLQVLQPKSRIRQLTGVVQHPYPISVNTHDFPGIKHFHTDLQYGFATKCEPSLPVSTGESQDLRWLTRSELNTLPASELFENTKEIYNFIFDEALEDWDQVATDNFLLGYPREYIS